MTKIIFVNGPAGSGKDTAIETITDFMDGDEIISTKMNLSVKGLVASVVGCTIAELEEDKRSKAIHGYSTSAEMQIATYEQMSKVFGRDWLYYFYSK